MTSEVPNKSVEAVFDQRITPHPFETISDVVCLVYPILLRFCESQWEKLCWKISSLPAGFVWLATLRWTTVTQPGAT